VFYFSFISHQRASEIKLETKLFNFRAALPLEVARLTSRSLPPNAPSCQNNFDYSYLWSYLLLTKHRKSLLLRLIFAIPLVNFYCHGGFIVSDGGDIAQNCGFCAHFRFFCSVAIPFVETLLPSFVVLSFIDLYTKNAACNSCAVSYSTVTKRIVKYPEDELALLIYCFRSMSISALIYTDCVAIS